MTYFRTGVRTIIGAKAFHGPVRDGKEWGHLAMVVRQKGLLRAGLKGLEAKAIESGKPWARSQFIGLIRGLSCLHCGADRLTNLKASKA